MNNREYAGNEVASTKCLAVGTDHRLLVDNNSSSQTNELSLPETVRARVDPTPLKRIPPLGSRGRAFEKPHRWALGSRLQRNRLLRSLMRGPTKLSGCWVLLPSPLAGEGLGVRGGRFPWEEAKTLIRPAMPGHLLPQGGKGASENLDATLMKVAYRPLSAACLMSKLRLANRRRMYPAMTR